MINTTNNMTDLRYVFETFRISNGKVLRLEDHLRRWSEAIANFGGGPSSFNEIESQLRTQFTVGTWIGRLEYDLLEKIWRVQKREFSSRLLAINPELVEIEIRQAPSRGFCSKWKAGPHSIWDPIRLELAEKPLREVVLADSSQILLEGSISSLFWAKNEVVFTPTLDLEILPGITRQRVLETCREIGVKSEIGCFNAEALNDADEIFLTNAVVGVAPAKLKSSPAPPGEKITKLLINSLKS